MTDLERTRRLLAEVFPHDAKFTRSDFLDWQYAQSPSGTVIESNTDDEVGRLGHYAVVPQRWRRRGADELWALSLNTAVSERARGQGLFTKQAQATYDLAASRGVSAIVGVANAQSTPGFLGKLGFDLVGPLDVSVLPWRPSRQARSFGSITTEDLASDDVLRSIQDVREGSVVRTWDAAELRWRLSPPAASFRLLRGDDVLAVTCASSHRGIPVAIVLKVFVRATTGPVDLAPVAAAACRQHRAVAALYAGRNPDLRVRGISLPQRFRPSPLNLIVKSLLPGEESSAFVPTTFEFLDFDAY